MHRYHAMPVFYDAYYTELMLEIEAGDFGSRDRGADATIELPPLLPVIAWALSVGAGLIALAQFL